MSKQTRMMYDATKSPVPGTDAVPFDPNPMQFRSTRIALAIQGVLLVALGIWGMIAALGTAHTGVSGAPVLVFHFTWAHAAVLIGAGVLSLVSTRKFRWGFWFSVAQAAGFMTLFITTMDERTWISDRADNALHAGIGIAGTGLLLWVAARGLSDWHWRPQRRGRASC